MNPEKRLSKINKRKQFLLNEIGKTKFAETITALETICDKQQLRLYQLSDIIQYRQRVDDFHLFNEKR